MDICENVSKESYTTGLSKENVRNNDTIIIVNNARKKDASYISYHLYLFNN